MKKTVLTTAILMASLMLGTSSFAADIEVENAWARATAPGAPTGAAYMTIKNNSKADDQLIAVEAGASKRAELHKMEMNKDMMKMMKVESIKIPAGGSVELKSGGLHVMMIGLKKQLEEGEMVHMTLKFKNGGNIMVMAPVKKEGPGQHDMHQHKHNH